MYHVGNKLVI